MKEIRARAQIQKPSTIKAKKKAAAAFEQLIYLWLIKYLRFCSIQKK